MPPDIIRSKKVTRNTHILRSFFVQLYQILQPSQLISPASRAKNRNYESIHGQARAIKMTFYRRCSRRYPSGAQKHQPFKQN